MSKNSIDTQAKEKAEALKMIKDQNLLLNKLQRDFNNIMQATQIQTG